MDTLDPSVALLIVITILAIGVYRKLYMEAAIALFFVPLLWVAIKPIPLGTTGYVPLETMTTFAQADNLTAWLIQWLSSPARSQLDVYAGLGIIIGVVFGIIWAFQMHRGEHWIQKILEKKNSALSQARVLRHDG